MLPRPHTLASGRKAVVSRGELVEIGGSFRIPEILERAGATLREVGTTNKTRLRDYERAIGPETGVVLGSIRATSPSWASPSAWSGRTSWRSRGRRGCRSSRTSGSGALVDLRPFGLPGGAAPQGRTRDGVPLACASGDKLLGGPQAGIPRRDAQARRRVPDESMARALRLDKLTIAALEATLRLYRDPEAIGSAIPTLRMIAEPASTVRTRARRLMAALGADRASRARAEVVPCTAEVGGGSMPLARIPSFAVALSAPGGTIGDLARTLRVGAEPVLGRIESGRLLLDL